MNKKVGIITYFDIADGKGRLLQAYALYSAIFKLGYTPQIIDYNPVFDRSLIARLKRASKNMSVHLFVNIIDTLLKKSLSKSYIDAKNRQRVKNSLFIQNHISMTEHVTTSDQLYNIQTRYDAIVCGSDQIWNPFFATGKDSAYFLQFADKYKRISYAPSFGTNNIPKDILEKLISFIQDIPYCSMREQSSVHMLNEQYGMHLTHVLDPTFLMTREWWNDFANSYAPQEPYVLSFLFDNSLFPREITRKIADMLHCKVINIPEDTLYDVIFSDKGYADISIIDFVSLFKNATFVCTQSFHGTVLSLLYNRPFLVFNRKVDRMGIFTRINDLLNLVELKNRIIYSQTSFDLLPPLDIDYVRVNTLLEDYRRRSLKFLKEALVLACSGSNIQKCYDEKE